MSEPATAPDVTERIQILRSIQQHHIQLSSASDLKASLLLAASLILITILYGQMIPGEMSLSLFALGVFTFAAAFLATLSLLPRTRPQPGRTHRMNLFFHGTFAQLSELEFTEAVHHLFENDRDAIEAMIRDIYQLGADIHLKKHRYLTWGYRAILAGLACGGIASFIELATK